LQSLIDRMPAPDGSGDFIDIARTPFPLAGSVEQYLLLVEADVLTHEINAKVKEVSALQADFNNLLTELNENNVQPGLVMLFEIINLPKLVVASPSIPS